MFNWKVWSGDLLHSFAISSTLRDRQSSSLEDELYGLHKASLDPNFVPIGPDRHLGAFRLTELQAQLKNLPRLFRLRMDRGRERALIMPSTPIRIRPGEGGQLIVQRPYSPDHVTKIKTVPGRRWHHVHETILQRTVKEAVRQARVVKHVGSTPSRICLPRSSSKRVMTFEQSRNSSVTRTSARR